MTRFCKKILISISILLIGIQAYALDIVYPRSENVNINAKSSFIVGNTNPKNDLYINGQRVYVHKNGAFARKILLDIGENVFKIQSGKQVKTYKITRKATLNLTYNAPQFKKYEVEQFAVVKNDVTALRSTPIESGINRLAHLEKGVILKIDGEKNNMYRVVLAENEYGWVNKSLVQIQEMEKPDVRILKQEFEQTNNAYFYRLKMNTKVPYSLKEGYPIKLDIYTLDGEKLAYEINIKHKNFGCDAYYEGDELVIRVNKKPVITSRRKPLKGINIVVDAGHGGNELGAISCLRNNEKDLNLDIALLLRDELTKKGAKVYMTRDIDKYMSLQDRVKFTHEKDALIFISIHANSLPDEKDPQKYRGSSTYYYYDASKELAESILNSMVEKLHVNDDGVHQRSFAVVRNERALSVLVETAYVINPFDNELLVDKTFQKNCAKAITKGVINFIKSE